MKGAFFPGDVIGEGLYFHNERVHPLPVSAKNHDNDDDLNAPSTKFEIVMDLGAGSYAVVYQVRKILSGHPPLKRSALLTSRVNLDEIRSSPTPVRYGRDYALKCISKINLDKDALRAQMLEVCGAHFCRLDDPI